jgi:acetyltransferase
MLTDALSDNGLEVPHISGRKADELLARLFPGSSVANPVDFLATGTAEQLGFIIDACEKDFDNIDAMAVIFGSPGLFPVYKVYDLLDEKMRICTKPIYPILPSVINVRDEIAAFLDKGRMNFPDEVLFGNALGKIMDTPPPSATFRSDYAVDRVSVRKIIDSSPDGYLEPSAVRSLLDAAGIGRAAEETVSSSDEALAVAIRLGYPVAMKVVGPVHKSDSGGVILNVTSREAVAESFESLMKIKSAKAVLIQKMHTGMEFFAGAKREDGFGHLVMAGMGGIFIEVLKDYGTALVPVSAEEARGIIKSLASYPLIKGIRGRKGINEHLFAEVITRLSALLE